MQIYKNCQIREELEKGYRWITLSQQINVGDTQDGYIYIHISIYIWCVCVCISKSLSMLFISLSHLSSTVSPATPGFAHPSGISSCHFFQEALPSLTPSQVNPDCIQAYTALATFILLYGDSLPCLPLWTISIHNIMGHISVVHYFISMPSTCGI